MKKKKRVKIGFILLSVLFMYFLFVTIEQQRILKSKDVELAETNVLIEEEKKLKDKLSDQLKTVNTDQYIEKTARQKLGLVREGERVFVDVNR